MLLETNIFLNNKPIIDQQPASSSEQTLTQISQLLRVHYLVCNKHNK